MPQDHSANAGHPQHQRKRAAYHIRGVGDQDSCVVPPCPIRRSICLRHTMLATTIGTKYGQAAAQFCVRTSLLLFPMADRRGWFGCELTLSVSQNGVNPPAMNYLENAYPCGGPHTKAPKRHGSASAKPEPTIGTSPIATSGRDGIVSPANSTTPRSTYCRHSARRQSRR